MLSENYPIFIFRNVGSLHCIMKLRIKLLAHSLDGFNAVRQSELTRPYLIPALDSLRWIQTNRRIFFLGSWLTSFLDGQTSAESLNAMDRFLSDHTDLPRDLREKILQAEDELARTVRIRGAMGTR